MENKQPNKFINFFKTYKLLTLTLFLFLVVLPVVTIPTIYIYQFASSKPVIFHYKDNKLTKINKQHYFDISFTLFSIEAPDADGKNGYYIFDYEIVVKDTVNEIVDIKFNAQLSVKNDNYTSHLEDLTETLESTTSSRLKIPFNYNMDKKILPFVRAGGPRLFLEIHFTELNTLLGEPQYETLYIEIPYN